MWGCIDNQDVGSEAATIERVRNSLLVECPCADNVWGLSDQPGGVTRQAARPEKTDGSARGSWGLGLRKQ